MEAMQKIFGMGFKIGRHTDAHLLVFGIKWGKSIKQDR